MVEAKEILLEKGGKDTACSPLFSGLYPTPTE